MRWIRLAPQAKAPGIGAFIHGRSQGARKTAGTIITRITKRKAPDDASAACASASADVALSLPKPSTKDVVQRSPPLSVTLQAAALAFVWLKKTARSKPEIKIWHKFGAISLGSLPRAAVPMSGSGLFRRLEHVPGSLCCAAGLPTSRQRATEHLVLDAR